MVPSFNALGTSFGEHKGGHAMEAVAIRLRMYYFVLACIYWRCYQTC